MRVRKLQDLQDMDVVRFIRDGYILVKPNLPREFHAEVYKRTISILESEDNPGNNILARVPMLSHLFEDSIVDGSITSILGPNYYMHPHRHCHARPPNSEGQKLHKDGFSRRRHRTRWILAMYYPQDTTVEMGPTAVSPGSQYYNTEVGGNLVKEIPLPVEAGTLAIVNYDIWHRGMANRSNNPRLMFKFLFLRMTEPAGPSWQNNSQEWTSDDDKRNLHMYSVWQWHRGLDNIRDLGLSQSHTVPHLLNLLTNNPEPMCTEAAYELGTMGDEAIAPLLDTLEDHNEPITETNEVAYGTLAHSSKSEDIRRNISYSLTSMGNLATPYLIDATEHRNWWVRDTAIETLGDIGLYARDAVKSVMNAVADDSHQVRRHAVEALGTIGQSDPTPVPTLIDALTDDDTVMRRNSTLALARIGENSIEAIPALTSALDDQDRYVRGKAFEALHRIHTSEAQEILIRRLSTARWCDKTTKEDLY